MEINSIFPAGSAAEARPDARAWVEVDLGAIHANVALLRALPGLRDSSLIAVVKADAYGHGLVPVAQTALAAGAEWLGVATVEEGVALRQAGLRGPILMICAPAPGEAVRLLRFGLTASVGDATTRDALAHAARDLGLPRPPAVHLEIDTGIGRAGVLPEEALAFWRETTAAGLRVTGLMSHFSDADGEEVAFTRAQQSAFAAVQRDLERSEARFDLVHLSNSAGVLRLGPAEGTMFRAGLLLYGIQPALSGIPHLPLQPAMTVKARVATVRSLPEGHPISYGVTHRLHRPSRVATVLIGYGDGYPRRLSNGGAMLLHGRRAPILGRVCMDQVVVDVTDIPGVAPGEAAVCVGRQGEERISVEEIAGRIATTEHEITTSLTARLPRVFL
jgi:alanine racemase